VVVTGTQSEEGTPGGLACLTEVRGRVVLFAAGPVPVGLERKLTTVGRDAAQIRLVVAADADALEVVRWLDAVAGGQARVFVPAGALPESALAEHLEEVATPTEVSPEVFATGLLALGSPTQAMAIRTPWGWIALTGCGGPATDEVVDRMLSTLGKPITWLVGGIHGAHRHDPDGAANLAARLRSLGVQRVAAAPCTSAVAREALRAVFGANLLDLPAGAVTTFKP
jgi:metal-dependent hydrolase (beta-lactamase superfamily II)